MSPLHVGGASNNLIDGASESVKFTFDSGSATGISFDDYYVVNLNSGLYSRPVGSVTGMPLAALHWAQ